METISMNTEIMSGRISLNRTMQYGNMAIGAFQIVDPPGLNRTMQYGNWKAAFDDFSKRWSLNRTMQYGNYLPQYFMRNNINV